MEIRFAVIPAEKLVNAKIGKLGIKLGNKFPHRFVVDNKKYLPHATLFKISVRKDKYSELLKLCQQFVKQFKAFEVQIKGFLIYDKGGWLALNVTANKQLTAFRKLLHEEIKHSKIVTIKPLNSIYKPHFTLSRFYSNDRSYQAIEGEPKQNFKIKVNLIGLCLSKQTQVYKILDKVKLK